MLLLLCVVSSALFRLTQAVVVAGKDKGPPLKLDLDITSEDLEKKLRECLASRGRKATDPKVLSMLSLCYGLFVASVCCEYGADAFVVFLCCILRLCFGFGYFFQSFVDVNP